MEIKKSHGILLQALPYLGNGRILKVFSEVEGLITLMAKNKPALSSPFCIAEWVYRKGRSEIFTLTEGSLLDPLIELRDSYENLTAAGSIAQDLLKTQMAAKPTPHLYALLSSYLKKISSFKNPSILALSFRLKVMIHEGLLTLSSICSHCKENASLFSQGESVCLTHASPRAFSFSPTEWETLLCLALTRKFSLLEPLHCPSQLNEKIEKLFEERMNH
jgi:DNA repair protein RecO (recombination protein O)